MHKLFHESQKALISLPPKNDTEAEVSEQWDFPEGVLNFEGQDFIFPKGFHAEAVIRWLENELLIAEIEVSAEISAECARCLKPVDLEISGNLMYLYYSRGVEAEDENEFDDLMPVEVDYFGGGHFEGIISVVIGNILDGYCFSFRLWSSAEEIVAGNIVIVGDLYEKVETAFADAFFIVREQSL